MYAQGLHANDEPKRQQVLSLIDAVPATSFILPVQVLGELLNVLTRGLRRSRQEAAQVVKGWQDTFDVVPTTPVALTRGMDLMLDHGLAVWDAIILATAAEAGCRVLLSEDMQDGFTWGGVTIVNPFASPPHPLLDDLPRRG